jgi:ubiquinone/menaquinone biosynthesis C-methylase UbiE
MTFYEQTVRRLLEEGVLSADDKVLIVCGGTFDAQAVQAAGLSNVLITNLDDRYNGYCAPYDWDYADAEALKMADNSFDWVFEHAGLHHCASPHLALLEMMRVARKGVLAVESRDSALMRTAVRLNFTSEYEIESVVLDANGTGGQRNTGVPNFVYRWTENEVRKTVESGFPGRINDIRYFYGLNVPMQRLSMASGFRQAAARILGVAARLAFKLMPKQGNQFAFAIINSGNTKSWLMTDEKGLRMNPQYDVGFDPKKYSRKAP